MYTLSAKNMYLDPIQAVNLKFVKGGLQDLKESAISELRPTCDETIDIVGCNLWPISGRTPVPRPASLLQGQHDIDSFYKSFPLLD